MNKLFYGDNLSIMKGMGKYSVDLVYLDPPFKSQQNYNLLYKTLTGKPVPEQAEAFCDTWEMDAEKEHLARTMPMLMREYGVEDYYVEFWRLWIQALRHTQPHLLAYLIYMVERLLHMKIILKPTGSIFLHCDPAASHYIKVMMDGIFGARNFRNEIIWKRTGSKGLQTRRLPSNHDVILYYALGDNSTWNADECFIPYDHDDLPAKTLSKYSHIDSTGRRYQLSDLTNPNQNRPNLTYEFMGVTKVWRWTKQRMLEAQKNGMIVQPGPGKVPRFKRYLDEQRGIPLDDVWTDIHPLNSQAANRMGYPTQKPPALLKRIILAASNKGDVVFDPFCGCGTTIYAAQQTERQWIGCDIAILAVRLVEEQLQEKYRLVEDVHYTVNGIPNSMESAQALFLHDPFQFEHWAVERVGGFPTKKTGDRGIDGRIYFDMGKKELGQMLLSVKGGKIRPTDIRDLKGVVSDEAGADMGGFICLEEPSKQMRASAAQAGVWTYKGTNYPKIQILTVRDIVEGKHGFDMPSKVGTKGATRQISMGL